MKRYISPELKISTSEFDRMFMLSGSDGEGNTIIDDGGNTGDNPGPTGPIEGDAKKRDELGYGSLW